MVEALGWGGISQAVHTLYPRLPPSSGLEQALPGPGEGPRVVTPRGKPHGCIRFDLPCTAEGMVGVGEWAIEGAISYWAHGRPGQPSPQTGSEHPRCWDAEGMRHDPCPLGVSP